MININRQAEVAREPLPVLPGSYVPYKWILNKNYLKYKFYFCIVAHCNSDLYICIIIVWVHIYKSKKQIKNFKNKQKTLNK